MREVRRNWDLKLRYRSRDLPRIQDDMQAINDQQEEEIWIDPDMREHPVAHWDGLYDEEEEDFEYTDNEDNLEDLEYEGCRK
jgi:hypothetical protein